MPGIVRNRPKIEAAANAKAFLAVERGFGSFDACVRRFAGGKPKRNAWRDLKQIPARTAESGVLSKDRLQRGFGLAGPTIVPSRLRVVRAED